MPRTSSSSKKSSSKKKKPVEVFSCGDSLPDDSYRMLHCEGCGGEFPHTKRGKAPKMCFRAKQELAKKQQEEREERRLAKQKEPKEKRVGVPIFEPVVLSELEKGDLVYRISKTLGSDIVQRLYAYEYKVSSINPVMVERNLKGGYRNYQMQVDENSGLLKKTGTEYVEFNQEKDEEEED